MTTPPLTALARRWHTCAIRMPSRWAGAAYGVVGVSYVADAITDWRSSTEADTLPEGLLAMLGVMLTIGGALIVSAVLSDPPNAATRWARERAGWWLCAGAWATYVVAYALGHITDVASIVLPLAWATSASYAIQRLNAAERRARAATGEVDL